MTTLTAQLIVLDPAASPAGELVVDASYDKTDAGIVATTRVGRGHVTATVATLAEAFQSSLNVIAGWPLCSASFRYGASRSFAGARHLYHANGAKLAELAGAVGATDALD